jgi:hypothetical protein
MDFKSKYISELIDIREEARLNKDWKLSDKLRNYLDTKQSFVFDTKDGQVVYHELKGMTRTKLIDKINKGKRAEKIFDAWLYSMRSSAEII